MHFSKGIYSSLALPSLKVVYSEISNNISKQEKLLFIKCISVNPTYYRSISVEGSEITSSSVILSDRIGYKYINLLNEFGEDRQITLRNSF